jgi:hypothetical protein
MTYWHENTNFNRQYGVLDVLKQVVLKKSVLTQSTAELTQRAAE